MSQNLDELCRKEVAELHRFFQDWMSGDVPSEASVFERFSIVLAPEFQIISPEGKTSTRDEILDSVKGAYGSESGRGFRVWIENYQGRPLREDIQFVNYQEWQESEGKRRGRSSTALFQRFPEAPNGVRWLRVSESWLGE